MVDWLLDLSEENYEDVDKALVHEQLIARVGEMQEDNTVAIPIEGTYSHITQSHQHTLVATQAIQYTHTHINAFLSIHATNTLSPTHSYQPTLCPTPWFPASTYIYHPSSTKAFMKMCEEEVERLELRRRARDKFKELDTDKSGYLDNEELHKVVNFMYHTLGNVTSPKTVMQIHTHLTID